jgi:hypothetical protein
MRENIIRTKYIAELDEPVVMFIVGGHMNKPWAIHRYLWIPLTFLKMIRDLHRGAKDETGFIDGHLLYRLFPLGLTFVSYWRSFDDLEAYARGKGGDHIKAWARYVKENDDAIAIWHETYLVEPGKFEAVYGNSAPYGLARVGNIEEAQGRKHNARGRFNPDDETVSEEPLIPHSWRS